MLARVLPERPILTRAEFDDQSYLLIDLSLPLPDVVRPVVEMKPKVRPEGKAVLGRT